MVAKYRKPDSRKLERVPVNATPAKYAELPDDVDSTDSVMLRKRAPYRIKSILRIDYSTNGTDIRLCRVVRLNIRASPKSGYFIEYGVQHATKDGFWSPNVSFKHQGDITRAYFGKNGDWSLPRDEVKNLVPAEYC